ncbi:MAG: hypothetical protein P4M04_15290 [Acidobacteriota bacterium]|nr:hypothetical protein [Acidobacteriota bacterium]
MTSSRCRGLVRGFALCLGCVGLFTLSAFALRAAARPILSQASSQASKNDYALIYGTVWGPDNHPVAGVPIKIRRAADKKAKWELVSDRHGEFAQRVPVGSDDYIIEAEVKTPKGQLKPQTQVHIDDNERKDVSVHLNK